MKKLILFFIVAVAAIMIGCEPEQNAWIWLVKNETQQPIKFKFPHSETYRTSTLMPGNSIFIYQNHINTRDNLHFDYYFEKSDELHEEGPYWQILSEDDIELKTWDYSDKGLPNQRFFDESAWVYETGDGSKFIGKSYSWTFDILPEDIQPTEQ